MWADRFFFEFQDMTRLNAAWYTSRTGINIILSIPLIVGLVGIFLFM